MEHYNQYLRLVYARMAQEVPPGALVLEVGSRTYRGVIAGAYLHAREFVAVDRDPERPGYTADVLEVPVHADVIISTCVLHHTPERSVPRLLRNLRAPLLMFSGPCADTHEKYGDHEWHLEPEKLRRWLGELGYRMTWERFGMTKPYCEAIVIARRRT